ncbi:MAG TPA: hypothetical protein VGH31_09870 [Acidimicrobiales bacterium]|jgi:hypothetical protein
MNTVIPDNERFEDRLLAAILDDFDHLTADTSTTSGNVRPIGQASRSRRAVPAMVVGVAAAALLAAGVVDLSSNNPKGATPVAAGHVTHAQLVLFQLASASAAAPSSLGRYVVLSETDTESDEPGQSPRTSVIDTETGASTTYQQPYADSNAPSVITKGPDPTSTEAWFTALPTDPTALRARLLAISKQQAAQTADEFQQQAAKLGKPVPKPLDAQPALTDDDYVYQEADDLLWSPLVQPTLRSTLYKVLADTSGFTINPNATDPDGRPAIAMTRQYNGVASTSVTYEDPATGAVLAQVWTSGSAPDVETITAVYQPVTSTDSIPANPYGN